MKKVFFLVTLLMSISAHAEILTGNCGKDGDNLSYTLDTETGTLKIEGSGDMKDYHYGSLAPWSKKGNIMSVEIGNSVASIGDCAFYECPRLTNVVIPHSVTSIGSEAFYNCTRLSSVSIPNSVTSIGSYAFSGCTSLPIENNIRYADIFLAEVVNKQLTEAQIKVGTRFIDNEAFYNCSLLTSVEIPNSVTIISNNSFARCSGLKNIVIPNSITSIGEAAFEGCSSLTSIEIPNSVTCIGNYAFENCIYEA